VTIAEFKSAIAGYLQVASADLTVNGVDLGLLALNQARRKAELEYDFEFQRRLVSLTVDGSTGGDLDDVVLYGTATSVDIKTILDMGQLDDDGNIRPVEWTTAGESLERQRQDNRFITPRYPTDNWARTGPLGRMRYELRDDKIYLFPRDATSSADVTVVMEIYAFTDNFTDSTAVVTGTLSPNAVGTYQMVTKVSGTQPFYIFEGSELGLLFYTGSTWALQYDFKIWGSAGTSSTDPSGSYTPLAPATGTATVVATDITDTMQSIWLSRGEQYLLWQSIVQLNHLHKEFVYRQEGNLAPPQVLADQGLAALREWDTMRFEAHRRHSR
jgi:hypothetical protein